MVSSIILELNDVTRLIILGATSRGFRRFLVQTVLKLEEGNLTHEKKNIFEHLKEDMTLICG